MWNSWPLVYTPAHMSLEVKVEEEIKAASVENTLKLLK